jgi:hypothetical protein
MPGDIPLQILLRPEWRSPAGVEHVEQRLAAVGLKPTGTGRATVSARGPADALISLFGVTRAELLHMTRAAAGGDNPLLRTPAPLEEYVESITVLPRPTRFNR